MRDYEYLALSTDVPLSFMHRSQEGPLPFLMSAAYALVISCRRYAQLSKASWFHSMKQRRPKYHIAHLATQYLRFRLHARYQGWGDELCHLFGAKWFLRSLAGRLRYCDKASHLAPHSSIQALMKWQCRYRWQQCKYLFIVGEAAGRMLAHRLAYFVLSLGATCALALPGSRPVATSLDVSTMRQPSVHRRSSKYVMFH